MRTFDYLIQKDSLSIEDYLKEKLWPTSIIVSLRQNNQLISVNGENKPTTYLLKPNDNLSIKLYNQQNTDIEKMKYELDIVYEDDDILIVNKPFNMPVHPSKGFNGVTLANAICYYLNNNDTFHCLTRLDKDTSGLVLIAKHKLAAAILSDSLHDKIQKQYKGIVVGKIEEDGIIDAPIAKKDNSIIREINYKTGKPSITKYQLINYYPQKDVSLVSFDLLTGRTHQIRVHCAHIGHPLVGDKLYNNVPDLTNHHLLCCCKLIFIHPITFKELVFEIDIDSNMHSYLEKSLES